jgi:hypothetical protein
MPYCHTSLQMKNPEEVENVLTNLTKEYFVAGQAAHRLSDGGFNIDAGKNDIRAYYVEGEKTIKFFCRFERDMTFYDKKLRAFATKYGIDTKNVN